MKSPGLTAEADKDTGFILPQGSLCPKCKTDVMEADASKALEDDGKFVVCSNCHAVRCAICGKSGLESSSTEAQHFSVNGAKRYICPYCLGGAVVLIGNPLEVL